MIEMIGLARHYNLTPPQLAALLLLGPTGLVAFKELRQLLGLPKSSLTAMVDTLEKRGMVRREQDNKDRRRWLIVLTPQGIKLTQELSQREGAILEPLTRLLPEGE